MTPAATGDLRFLAWRRPLAGGGFLELPSLAWFLLTAYLACLPAQVPVGSTNAGDFAAWGMRVAPSDLFLAAFALVAFHRIRIRPNLWSAGHPLVAALFMAGAALGAMRTGHLTGYILINKLIGFVLLVLTYAVVTSVVRSWEDVRAVLKTFILAVTLHNVIALVAFFLGAFFGRPQPWINFMGARLAGLLVDPNAYGGMIVVAFGAHTATHNSSWPLFGRWSGMAVTMTLALGVLFTFSRSSWIGCTMGLAFLAWHNRALALRLVGALVAAVAGLVVVLGPERIANFSTMAKRPEQIMDRVHQITQGLDLVNQYPVFGAGFGVFGERNAAIIHNTTFWFLVEFGFVGLGVFAFFYLWFVKKGLWASRNAPPEARGLALAALFGHIAMFGVSFGIEAFYQRSWWLFMALIAVTADLARRSREEDEA